ncbi:hypothetical protein BDZ97DRAFT_1794706, partial [Flammula alnicola]
MSAHFPPEIDDEILSHLWDKNDSLKACSLACRAFLPACQKHLLSKIVLFPPTDEKKRGNGARFRRLLENSPHIFKYVHYLEVIDCKTEETEWLSKDTTLTYSLPLLRCLKALVIQYRTSGQGGNWGKIARGALDYAMNLALAPATPPIDSAKTIYLDSLSVQLANLGSNIPGTTLSQGWLADMINNALIDVTKLKKLRVAADKSLETHDETWMLLSRCADSLEELAFDPALDSMFIFPFHYPFGMVL